MSTENVRSYGTLLQDAVSEKKKNFVQILLDFGFVSCDNDADADAADAAVVVDADADAYSDADADVDADVDAEHSLNNNILFITELILLEHVATKKRLLWS